MFLVETYLIISSAADEDGRKDDEHYKTGKFFPWLLTRLKLLRKKKNKEGGQRRKKTENLHLQQCIIRSVDCKGTSFSLDEVLNILVRKLWTLDKKSLIFSCFLILIMKCCVYLTSCLCWLCDSKQSSLTLVWITESITRKFTVAGEKDFDDRYRHIHHSPLKSHSLAHTERISSLLRNCLPASSIGPLASSDRALHK